MRINGLIGETISAADRGLHYGDGLFETIAVRGAKPQLWLEHMDRLARSCQRLGIAPPCPEQLRSEAGAEIASAKRGVLKLLLTRGCGGRGYRPPAAATPSRLIAFHPWPDYAADHWSQGVCVRYCRTRLGQNPLLAGIKHLNRLEQVLARAEWSDPTIAEGLMLDSEGCVIEGTMSNLFVLRHGHWLTPALNHCGIAGVMRRFVLDTAAAWGLPMREAVLRPSDLLDAEAAFLTNSLIGIWPVREIEGRRYDTDAIPQQLMQAVGARSYDGVE
jgi:4-amino-4-deoxychorismate lyase